MPVDDAKSELRLRLRARRRALAAEEQRRAAHALDRHVARLRLFQASRRVACYLPNDGEIDPGRIIERVWRLNKTCYLPVLSHLSWDRLWFAPTAPGMELAPNRFGIPEPKGPARKLVRAEVLDLILLPLVGFDREGHRLGMGGGFYDKSLAFLGHRHHWRKPHVVGLAYDFQRVENLPSDPWDVRLQAVVTDQALYWAND